MLEQFLNHLQRVCGCTPNDRFLLAVSGGVDSMAMLDLFRRAGLEFAVAHANFGLRGGESDEEEAFVTRHCNNLGVPVFARRFDTKSFAAAQGLSVQVAARELRYTFFAEVASAERYNWVATAHHLNDSIETVLLNLVRGTGIDGLGGIPAVSGNVVRPLLFATRLDVEQYAAESSLEWRTDSSNRSDDYSRNLLRNRVIPLLRELNPSLEKTFRHTLERMEATQAYASRTLREVQDAAVTIDGDRMLIQKAVISSEPFPAFVLWNLLRSHGFRYDTCRQMVSAHEVGKWFSAGTVRLVVDRTHYVVETVTKDATQNAVAENPGEIVLPGQSIRIQLITGNDAVLSPEKNKAFLDADKVGFPLIWRTWEPGDSFQPLGMKHHKKISDFLIDAKLDRLAKEKVTVIESGGEIVWVVGHRIADPAKVTPVTRRVIVLEWENDKRSTH